MASDDMRLTRPRDGDVAGVARDEPDTQVWELYEHPPGHVRLNLVASADGRAAGPDGSSRSINGPADLRVLRAIRSWADVVLVGARTATGERYGDIRVSRAVLAERERRGQSPQPQLAIVTWSGDLPPGLSPAQTWVITVAHSPAAQRLRGEWATRLLIAGEDEWDASSAIAALGRMGLVRIVCEGGPQIATWLLSADAVDDFCLTRSPLPGGEHAALVPQVPPRWSLEHRLDSAGFVMERWTRPDSGGDSQA